MKHSKGSVRTDGYEGRLAQLEERLVCNQKAGGSNPPASTTLEESITPEWDTARKLLECVLKPPSRIRNAGWAVPSEEIFVAKQCAFLHAASRAGVKMSSE